MEVFSNKKISVFKDFNWSWRGVTVTETDTFIPFSKDLIWDLWRGGLYIICEWLRPRRRPIITKTLIIPRPPRPWYLIWGSLRQAGITPGTELKKHVLTIYFYDKTYTDTESSAELSAISINAKCTDISKTRVTQVFESVFGYSLAIDPLRAKPPFMAKSEYNGRHDGHIIYDNTSPKDGWVYQRLIDNSSPNNHVIDIRCPTIFGEIPLIYLKERPKTQRFANLNTKCRLVKPGDWLTKDEQEKVSQFCHKIGLDWGGLDILRDNIDGRIYIVDVNKTDMGPPLALKLRDKLRSTKILGQALRKAIAERLP